MTPEPTNRWDDFLVPEALHFCAFRNREFATARKPGYLERPLPFCRLAPPGLQHGSFSASCPVRSKAHVAVDALDHLLAVTINKLLAGACSVFEQFSSG